MTIKNRELVGIQKNLVQIGDKLTKRKKKRATIVSPEIDLRFASKQTATYSASKTKQMNE